LKKEAEILRAGVAVMKTIAAKIIWRLEGGSLETSYALWLTF